MSRYLVHKAYNMQYAFITPRNIKIKSNVKHSVKKEINDKSKKTYLITSGINNPTIKSVTIYKHTKLVPKKFKKLIQTSLNLEKVFKNDRLDIEFSIKT